MLKWERKFETFDEKHPEVYTEFKRYAHRIRARGFHRYSAQTIFCVMRFHSDVDGRPDESFKLTHAYYPYYARKLMKEDPTFEGFFETRALREEAA